MHSDETRESQPVRNADGGADSHEVVNPPAKAGCFSFLTSEAIHRSNADTVASAGEPQPTPNSLTEAQLATFWAGILANMDAARRVASRIVRRQDVDDVVHTGALRFIESLEGPEARPFPATDGVLRALFMDIVRRYAFDCVRDGKRPATDPLQLGNGMATRRPRAQRSRSPARLGLRAQQRAQVRRASGRLTTRTGRRRGAPSHPRSAS